MKTALINLNSEQIEKLTGAAFDKARADNIFFATDWRDIESEEWEKFGAPNFTPEELADSVTGELLIDTLALHRLQILRNQKGFALPITSGYRSISTNNAVGGSETSAHIVGRAFDIGVGEFRTNTSSLNKAISVGFCGIGIKLHGPANGRYMHVDDVDRIDGPALWTYP